MWQRFRRDTTAGLSLFFKEFTENRARFLPAGGARHKMAKRPPEQTRDRAKTPGRTAGQG